MLGWMSISLMVKASRVATLEFQAPKSYLLTLDQGALTQKPCINGEVTGIVNLNLELRVNH